MSINLTIFNKKLCITNPINLSANNLKMIKEFSKIHLVDKLLIIIILDLEYDA
jgi:hypothetical protein